MGDFFTTLLLTILLTLPVSTLAASNLPPGVVGIPVPTYCRADVGITVHIIQERYAGKTREQILQDIDNSVAAYPSTISEEAVEFAKLIVEAIYDYPPKNQNDVVQLINLVVHRCEIVRRSKLREPRKYSA